MLYHSDPSKASILHMSKFWQHFSKFLLVSVNLLTHTNLFPPVGLGGLGVDGLDVFVAIILELLQFSFLIMDSCYWIRQFFEI